MRPEYECNLLNGSVFFLLMVFYGMPFNVKLCTLCLYTGFIFLPVQTIYIIKKVFAESHLIISAFYYVIT